MNKKWIFLFLTGCCACNSLTNNSSANILPLDSVAVIIADSYFLESEIYATQWKYDAKKQALAKYDFLFEKHGLTKETYLQNVRYYLTNKKLTNLMMNKVDEIIEQRVAILRDSLNVE